MALTALVAFVAAGFRATVRTGPLDVAVGEVVVGRRIVGDDDLVFVDVVVFVQRPDDIAGEFGVGLVVGVTVVVELDVELGERLLVLSVPLEGELGGIDALFFGVDGDRRAVHVGAGDVRRLLAKRLEGAGEGVRADVSTEVTDVQVAVGVGQPAGHDRGRSVGKSSLVICVWCRWRA